MKNRILDWRFAVILIIAAMMIYRTPYLFSNPRFWAEEGRVYFYTAFHSAWYEALFSPHLGYYSGFPNLMTLLAARLAPLEYAPLFTTIAAFLAQLLPCVVVLYRLKDTLQPAQQILLCAVVVFVVHTGEVWLNTITLQFHFAVVSFFILIANHDQASRGQVLFDRAVIALSGFTGVISCFLLPAFAVRWSLTRNRNLLILSFILAFSCVAQFCSIAYSMMSGGGAGDRFSFPGLASILKTWQIQFLLWPILSGRWQEILGSELLGGSAAMWILMAALLTATRIDRQYAIPIFVAFLIVSALSLIGSLGMTGGWRYAYAPAVILLSLFVVGIKSNAPRLYGTISWLMLLLSIGFWIPRYRASLEPWVVPNGPVWMEEVRNWRQNPDSPLWIYPQWENAKWHIMLRKQ